MKIEEKVINFTKGLKSCRGHKDRVELCLTVIATQLIDIEKEIISQRKEK